MKCTEVNQERVFMERGEGEFLNTLMTWKKVGGGREGREVQVSEVMLPFKLSETTERGDLSLSLSRYCRALQEEGQKGGLKVYLGDGREREREGGQSILLIKKMWR